MNTNLISIDRLFGHVVPMLALAGIFLSVIGPSATLASDDTAASAKAKPFTGMWLWRSSSIETSEARQRLWQFCSEYGFDRVLVQIHCQGKGQAVRLRHPESYAALLREAAEQNVVIEALEGEKDMAQPDKVGQTLARLDAILAFNRSLPVGHRFAGVHYDIEPYLMKELWESDERQSVMRNYLDFLATARKRLTDDGSGLILSVDIPFWYDHKTEPGDSCVLEYNGSTKNLHEHVQDLTDYIGIMSYRRFAAGRNGVLYHCRNELAYGRQIGKHVAPAIEVGPSRDVAPISFHGLPPATFWQELNVIRTKLADDAAYAGVFVHCYEHLLDYLGDKNQSAPKE